VVRDPIAKLAEFIGPGRECHDSAAEFLQKCQPARPDCRVLDVHMPEK